MGALLIIGALMFLTAGAAVESLAESEEATEQFPAFAGGFEAAADLLTIVGYVILGVAGLYILAGYYVARMKIFGWVLLLTLSGFFMSAALVGREVSPSNLSLWLNLVIVILLLLRNTRHDCGVGRPPDPTIDEIMAKATDDMIQIGTSTPMPGYTTPGAGFNLPSAYSAIPLDPDVQERVNAARAQASTLEPTYASPHEKAVWDHGSGHWVLWDAARGIFHRHEPADGLWYPMD